MVDYSIKITSLDCYPTLDDKEKVVYGVAYTMYGTSGSFSAGMIAYKRIPYDAASHFVPFEELTQPEVEDWINTYGDPDEIPNLKRLVEANIVEQMNPTTLTLQPPF